MCGFTAYQGCYSRNLWFKKINNMIKIKPTAQLNMTECEMYC